MLGGEPIRKSTWPTWPRADENTEKNIKDVLYSSKWTISGPYIGRKSYERQFAEAYSKFHNVKYCVPSSNGSSALTIALEALNVKNGMEVLVPGLTWVACASSVVGIGGIPILVDIEPDSLCMSLEDAKRKITNNTAAIILVHTYCSIADINGFVKLSEELNIPIIEDCSHAHGTIFEDQRVGTFGKIGIFSMQQSKVLTCGEGGACITNDFNLYKRMQQFRADGRCHKNTSLISGQMELEEVGLVQGRNYCMSEFHASILLDRLKHLDKENKIREENANYLNSLLLQMGDIMPLSRQSGINRLTYYQYCVRLNLKVFGNTIDIIAQALSFELGILISAVYDTLNNNVLYNPLSSPRIPDLETSRTLYNPKRYHLPIAEKASKECLAIPHNALLGDKKDMEDIAEAFAKIKKNCSIISGIR